MDGGHGCLSVVNRLGGKFPTMTREAHKRHIARQDMKLVVRMRTLPTKVGYRRADQVREVPGHTAIVASPPPPAPFRSPVSRLQVYHRNEPEDGSCPK